MSVMDEHREAEELFGLCLTSEAIAHDPERDSVLGTIVCHSLASLTVAQLRIVISDQIQTLPNFFIFVTEQGWPVQKSQEGNIASSSIITSTKTIRIQKYHERSRLGVRIADGPCLGFVLCELHQNLKTLRDCVRHQLGSKCIGDGLPYRFVDRNGWPVNIDQEYMLTALDISHRASVTIVSAQTQGSGQLSLTNGHHNDNDHHLAQKKARIAPQLTFRSGKDVTREINLSNEEHLGRKQILISYVRAEAAKHALQLKRALTEAGFGVFLDVDEIKSGTDWQDALNSAVNNCQVFIPLITSRYGKTLWTNREIKLADVLNKHIIPISFVEMWPPKCLSIQFATIQYIKWKTPEEIQKEMSLRGCSYEECKDIQEWDHEVILRVCGSISDHIHAHGDHGNRAQSIQSLPSAISSTDTCPLFGVRTSTRLPGRLSLFEEPDSSHNEGQLSHSGQPSVLICSHHNQMAFVDDLKNLFTTNNFSVWCSVVSESDTSPVSVSGEMVEQKNSPGNPQQSEALEKYAQFQEEVDQASVVICVLSRDFCQSKKAQQQVFYCEQRKPVIAVNYDDFHMPGWMSVLIGASLVEDVRNEGFRESLMAQVKVAINCTSSQTSQMDITETKICHAAQVLHNLLPKENCVYITGGTPVNKQSSKDICSAVGKHLAETNVNLVTGKCWGVGDLVGKSFTERRVELSWDSAVWHVLPVQDKKDNKESRQALCERHSGKIVFSGDSVKEREMTVSRIIEICVLIEGGPEHCHEVEQFIWNDHAVIPVLCSESGLVNIPEKIKEIPPGVSSVDWSVIKDAAAEPDVIGQSVANIIRSLQEHNSKIRAESDHTVTLARAVTLSPPSLQQPVSYESNHKRRLVIHSPDELNTKRVKHHNSHFPNNSL